jgi:hypothetical protein
MPVFVNNHSPVQATRPSSPLQHSIATATFLAKQQLCLDADLLDTCELSDNALFIQDRVCASDAASEIRFQVFDWKRRRDEVQCCRRRKAGTMPAQKIQCWA